MGLLKKILTYSLFIILAGGCNTSLIRLESYKDVDPYSQYGKSPYRDFRYEKPIGLTFTEKWEASINGGFTNSSVAVYDSSVFVNDLSGRLYSFSILNGKTLGQLKFKGSIFTTPIIENSLIIFAVARDKENISTLHYYDFNAGTELSSVEIEGRVTSQLLKLNDGIILLSETGHLYKLDYRGKIIWHYETNYFCHSSPASNNKVIVFGNDNGEIICVESEDLNRNTDFNSRLIYREKIGGPFFCGAVISDDVIYIGNNDGKLYAIDINSGIVKWSFQTNAMIKMEAVVADKEIFIGNLSGELYKLSKNDGKQIWKINTYGLLNSTPLMTPEYLILPDMNKKVYFISVDSGEIVDSLMLDGRVKLSPVIKNDLLFIGYENGNLRAYDVSNK